VLQPNTIATCLRVWQKHGAVINQYIFDLFLLGFGQADKATLKFSNIITSNTGLIGDVPRRDAHKGTTSTCKVGIENILLSSHNDPLYRSVVVPFQFRPLCESGARLGPLSGLVHSVYMPGYSCPMGVRM